MVDMGALYLVNAWSILNRIFLWQEMGVDSSDTRGDRVDNQEHNRPEYRL